MAKTTRRLMLSSALGILATNNAALAAAVGMDATDPKFIAAMDAETDAPEKDAPAGGGAVTLEAVATMLEDAGPALAQITEAAALIAGGATGADPVDPAVEDDMEPVVDAAGAPVMDAFGKPTMKKKTAATDAVPPALAATDAAISGMRLHAANIRKMLPKGAAAPAALVAMDAAIAGAEKSLGVAKRRFAAKGSPALAAMDARLAAAEAIISKAGTGTDAAMRSAFAEIASRDKLANRVSAFIGTFDHSEMTTADVATYALDKLEISGVTKGTEVATLTGYLHNRDAAPKSASTFGMDAATVKPSTAVTDYLNNGTKAA